MNNYEKLLHVAKKYKLIDKDKDWKWKVINWNDAYYQLPLVDVDAIVREVNKC